MRRVSLDATPGLSPHCTTLPFYPSLTLFPSQQVLLIVMEHGLERGKKDSAGDLGQACNAMHGFSPSIETVVQERIKSFRIELNLSALPDRSQLDGDETHKVGTELIESCYSQ